MFSDKEISKARELSYANWENNGDIGFEYNGRFITNPFIDESGRFEFTNFEAVCDHYGKDNVIPFIKEILCQEENNS